jgi:hypothetical protein
MTQTLSGRTHFILQLQIHPEFLGHAEETSQSDSGISGDAAPFEDDVVDAGSGHVNGASELVGRNSHRLQKFLAKNLAGMDFPIGGYTPFSGHRVLLNRLMIVRDFDVERVTIFPQEANPELIIDSYAELAFTFALQRL